MSQAHVLAVDVEELEVVARLDGRFVGFVNVLWDGDTHAFLEDVIVAADARHQGVGVAIVHAARDGARAAGCEH